MPSLLASVACQGQRFVLTEYEAGRLRIRHGRLRFEGGDALECRRVRRHGFRRRQLKLRSFAMLGADFNKRVERAWRNVKAQSFLKQASDVTVSLPLAAQFSDEIAVGFQFGARWLWRQVGKSSDDLTPFQRGGEWLKNHD